MPPGTLVQLLVLYNFEQEPSAFFSVICRVTSTGEFVHGYYAGNHDDPMSDNIQSAGSDAGVDLGL